MKRFLKPAYLPWIVLSCGIAALLVRLWLIVGIGRDDRGLLNETSFPSILSWILVAVTMAVAGLGVWKTTGEKPYKENFPSSLTAAIGIALAGVCFCVSSVMGLLAEKAPNYQFGIVDISNILGLFAAAGMLVLAWFRYKGQRPNMLLHSVVCVYLMVYLVSHYQLWTSTPQLQSCFFEMLAIVFAMLACYQRAAFDLEEGSHRAYTFFSLSALFFSLATLPDWNDPVFFMGCAVWMLFTPCKAVLPEAKEN